MMNSPNPVNPTSWPRSQDPKLASVSIKSNRCHRIRHDVSQRERLLMNPATNASKLGFRTLGSMNHSVWFFLKTVFLNRVHALRVALPPCYWMTFVFLTTKGISQIAFNSVFISARGGQKCIHDVRLKMFGLLIILFLRGLYMPWSGLMWSWMNRLCVWNHFQYPGVPQLWAPHKRRNAFILRQRQAHG